MFAGKAKDSKGRSEEGPNESTFYFPGLDFQQTTEDFKGLGVQAEKLQGQSWEKSLFSAEKLLEFWIFGPDLHLVLIPLKSEELCKDLGLHVRKIFNCSFENEHEFTETEHV